MSESSCLINVLSLLEYGYYRALTLNIFVLHLALYYVMGMMVSVFFEVLYIKVSVILVKNEKMEENSIFRK